MKVLIYTSIFPFPLDQGGKIAQYTFIETLVKENDVLLVCEKYDDCRKDLSVLKKILPSLRIKLLEIKEQIKTGKSIKTSLWSITKKNGMAVKKKNRDYEY